MKLLAEHNLHMRVVSPEEESAYLAAASQPLRDVATIILETGMRPGEVFHLRREDVNLEIGFLQVPQGKTLFARRTIPLTRRALTVCSRRVSEATTEWVFPSRNDPERPIGWLRKAHIEALRLVRNQSALSTLRPSPHGLEPHGYGWHRPADAPRTRRPRQHPNDHALRAPNPRAQASSNSKAGKLHSRCQLPCPSSRIDLAFSTPEKCRAAPRRNYRAITTFSLDMIWYLRHRR